MLRRRFTGTRALIMALLAAGLVSGCITPSQTPQHPTAHLSLPAGFPAAQYRHDAALGKKVLDVSPQLSLVTIEVRRAGRLARLGHDHVVASHDVRGYVEVEDGRADLYVPLTTLTVDETALRVAAGFDTQPSPEAIEGTRNNMLNKVLEADRFPYALIHVTRNARDPDRLRVALTLHGTTRAFDVPARLEIADNRINVNGRLTFNQSEFGMEPFSILGGAIRVQDRVDLQFRIVANSR
jgi:polyisoprenoid-binding protein YceI